MITMYDTYDTNDTYRLIERDSLRGEGEFG